MRSRYSGDTGQIASDSFEWVVHFHLISSSIPFLSESWGGGHLQARPSAVPGCIQTPSSLEMTAPRVCVVPPRAPPPPLWVGRLFCRPGVVTAGLSHPPRLPSTWISLRLDGMPTMGDDCRIQDSALSR